MIPRRGCRVVFPPIWERVVAVAGLALGSWLLVAVNPTTLQALIRAESDVIRDLYTQCKYAICSTYFNTNLRFETLYFLDTNVTTKSSRNERRWESKDYTDIISRLREK